MSLEREALLLEREYNAEDDFITWRFFTNNRAYTDAPTDLIMTPERHEIITYKI